MDLSNLTWLTNSKIFSLPYWSDLIYLTFSLPIPDKLNIIEGNGIYENLVTDKKLATIFTKFSKELSIDISNISLITSEGEPTRVGFKIEKDKKVRYSKKSDELL